MDCGSSSCGYENCSRHGSQGTSSPNSGQAGSIIRFPQHRHLYSRDGHSSDSTLPSPTRRSSVSSPQYTSMSGAFRSVSSDPGPSVSQANLSQHQAEGWDHWDRSRDQGLQDFMLQHPVSRLQFLPQHLPTAGQDSMDQGHEEGFQDKRNFDHRRQEQDRSRPLITPRFPHPPHVEFYPAPHWTPETGGGVMGDRGHTIVLTQRQSLPQLYASVWPNCGDLPNLEIPRFQPGSIQEIDGATGRDAEGPSTSEMGRRTP